MATVVVPFRGSDPKRRLDPVADEIRLRLAEAMLGDVLDAAVAVGRTFVVSVEPLPFPPGVEHVVDPGHGQGLAVRAALDAAAGVPSPYLVVNADLPCVTPRDLLALAGAIPEDGLAIARAADGTTNALGLAGAGLFEPLYGAGSAQRYAMLAPSRLVHVPNLLDDVDTLDDLHRLADRLGPRTRAVLDELDREAA
jgi:2-phospho-L-lactate guanylyltransferase (CobY/MobA/RfbA family)